MKKIFAILMLLLNCPVLAWSADCVTVPTCAEMGYKLTAPKGDGWLCTACPTDPTKFACSEKPCPRGSKGNASGTDKCWGGKSGDSDCVYSAKERRSNPGGSTYAYEYTCD